MNDNQIKATIIDTVNKKTGGNLAGFGNITRDGTIGTTADQILYTTTDGLITAGAIPAALLSAYTKSATGNYTGNGSGSTRDISLSFTPKIVIIVSRTSSPSYAVFGVSLGTNGAYYKIGSTGESGFTTGFVLATDKFTVGNAGNMFNYNTTVYDYIALS